MRNSTPLTALSVLILLGLAGCSSDSSSPTDPNLPGGGDSFIGSLSFADYGAAARQVLPPVYENDLAKVADDFWRDGDYPLLGKVFSEYEPMSIHSNINDHDRMMEMVESLLAMIAAYEAEHGTLPDEDIDVSDPEIGNGTMSFTLIDAPAPIPVPEICRTVFGRDEVVVDHLLHISMESSGGDSWSSPYIGFSASDEAQVIYYWNANQTPEGEHEGTQLFLAYKDVASDSFEIAGAYFKHIGPGNEERCNWVYHLTGNADYEFTYNMGWYAENPEFQLFGCVQGSGNKDVEFGLRYHQYTDTSGWDTIDEWSFSEEIFGPVGDDPYAYIEEQFRIGTIDDYVDASIMFVVGDSPLADIPNPFLAFLE